MERVARPVEGGIVGAVLAGGGSRRMGRDKRLVQVDGVPLVARAVRAVASATDRVDLIGAADLIGSDGRLPDGLLTTELLVGGRVLADHRPDAGPLAGVETALRAHPEAGAVLIVGVDHPWLHPAVLALLVDRLTTGGTRGPDAAMLVTDRGPQPLVASYRPSALPAVAALLEGGERRLRVLADHLDVLAVDEPNWRDVDPFGASAVDVDTPEELARAVTWAERVRATQATPVTPVGQDTPTREVIRVAAGRSSRMADTLINEEPLEVRAGGPGQEPVTLMTTLRTPGHEREQAVGWLLAEAFTTPDEVVEVSFGDPILLSRPDDTVTVTLTHRVDPAAGAHRHAVATASCGVCGRASIDELAARTRPVTGDGFTRTPVAWGELAPLPDRLQWSQARFHATGGVHATGLFDRDGRLVTVREDVGRHNALDAAIGAHVLAGAWPVGGLDDLICVLSGRIGFELVAKAAVARLPIVIAVGAASDLAVRTAQRLGITLVGFARGANGTVYTHPERLVLP